MVTGAMISTVTRNEWPERNAIKGLIIRKCKTILGRIFPRFQTGEKNGTSPPSEYSFIYYFFRCVVVGAAVSETS